MTSLIHLITVQLHHKIMSNSNYSEKSEVGQVFKVLDSLSESAQARQTDVSLSQSEQPLLAISSLGRFGRFGNQLFQYAFLKICAKQSGAMVECPAWIGQTLFGCSDPEIVHRLTPAIESQSNQESFFDLLPEFVPYIEKLANQSSCKIGADALKTGAQNVDLWGFFQFHTRFYLPHKEYFQSLFLPVDALKIVLDNGLNFLKSQGKTLVAIHLRQGDFVKLPLAGFTLITPARWWRDWLRTIWHKLDDPVLFICSDELEKVLPEFSEFKPITWKDLPIELPEQMKNQKIEFYIDFFVLSNCNVLGISNSIFSFSAAMLNNQSKLFIRPHWDFSTKFTTFDPWNSEPLLYFGSPQPKFSKNLIDALKTTLATQGFWAMLKCLFIYIPQSLLRKWSVRMYLKYQVQGLIGMWKVFSSLKISS
ncbi:MAG: alpha-1,2-fucosyltransferase [Scytolyngbya sp. HA4215-MV1]|jgi:hypothetical protein|nr:alpha-1,2-fucosyltransferase [Scytolyngbya sp. HA4215-MV1]